MLLQGKIEAAERNFARILSVTPHHIHARIGLGYCAWLTGDRVRAAKYLNEVVELDLTDEDVAIDCATALSHINEYATADALLARKTQTSRLRAVRSEIAEQRGDFDGAIIFYEKIFADDELPNETAFYRLLMLYRRAGRFDAALTLVDRLEAAFPTRVGTAAHSRGQIFLAMGRSDDAIAAFSAGLVAEPHAEACLLALSREWRRLGRHSEAEALLKDGQETAILLLERSDLALARRDSEEARRHAEAADRLLPKRTDALLRLCRIEIDQGRFVEARVVADRMLGKGAEHRVDHLRALADIARAADDDQEVKKVLDQLVALQPMDALARVDLARAWRKLGNGVDAAAELSRALDCDPRSVFALGEAGEQAQRDGDYLAAAGFYRKILEIAPEQVHHYLRLARLLQIMNDDEQDAVLNACLVRFGSIPELRLDKIRRLRDAGQLEEAFAEANEGLAAYPGIFGFWNDCFDLTLRLRPPAMAEALLTRIPVRSRREEIIMASNLARLSIRKGYRDEARAILEVALLRDPNNRSYVNELFLLSVWRNDLPEATKLQRHLTKLSAAERRFVGETANASQSHSGQIVNDMRLDMRAMTALNQAKGGTSRGQIRRLTQLVKERPDHIPTALALVVTLAESGRFEPPPLAKIESTAHGHIPPRITQYWNEECLPADLRVYSDSWSKANPGYEHRVFNDLTARAYLQEKFPPEVLQAYHRAQDATTKADLFRLAVLVFDGGVWSDIDDRCVKPVVQLFRPMDRAVFWQERSGHICNNFMASTPDNPILRRALITAVNAINRGDHDKVWMLTGPGLITRCFAQELAAAGESWQSWLEQVNVIDEFDIWPIIAMHCIAVYKRQGRHWHKEAFEKKPSALRLS